jgi:hypothetical protein
MLKKLWILALVALMGAWSVTIGCDDSDGDGDSDGDVDGDVDGDTDGDADGDWPCEQPNPDVAQMRMTSLEISAPPALTLPALQTILNDAMDEFDFLWLFEVDFAGASMTTGSGTATVSDPITAEEFCHASWNPDYPASTVGLTVTGDSISTATPIDNVTIPVYSGGSLLLELPLTQLTLTDVAFDAEHTLVGTPNPPPDSLAYAADWEENGSLEGYLGFDDAEGVLIEDLGMTLCALLCPGDCSTVTDPLTECTNPPEEIPGSGGTLGYRLAGTVGGAAITID